MDLLCTLASEADGRCGLLEWLDLKLGLEELFGRPVDLVSRCSGVVPGTPLK